jgi:hypothetical protein
MERQADRIRATVKERLLLLVIVMIACLLHTGLVIRTFCVSSDEAFSWRVASESHLSRVIELTARDVHPPLYYVCLAVWMRFFGDSAATLRALSGVFSIGTVLAVYWYTRIWAGPEHEDSSRGAAALAAALVALCMPQVVIAHTARMYAQMSLLTVLACAGLLLAARRPQDWRPWALYVVTAAAMLYTHNYGLYLIAGQAIWLLWEAIRQHDRRVRYSIMRRGMGAFALIGGLYLPWVPWLLWQMKMVSTSYWIRPLDWRNVAVLVVQFFNTPSNRLPLMAWYFVVLAAFATLLIIWPWRRAPGERQLIAILATHVVAILLANVIMGRSVFTPRFIVHLLPLCVVPIAFWLCRIRDHRIRRLVVCWVVFVASSTVLSVIWNYLYFVDHRPGFDRLIATMLERPRPDEPVFVLDAGNFLIVKYYYETRHADKSCFFVDGALDQPENGHRIFASAIRPEDRWKSATVADFRGPRCWIFYPDGIGQEPSGWQVIWEYTFVGSLPHEAGTIVKVGYYSTASKGKSG